MSVNAALELFFNECAVRRCSNKKLIVFLKFQYFQNFKFFNLIYCIQLLLQEKNYSWKIHASLLLLKFYCMALLFMTYFV